MWNDGGLRENPREGMKPLPSPTLRVAGSAIDVVALASALENFFGHGKRHVVAGIVADFAGVEIGVFVELAAGDGAFDRRAGGALVGEEIAVGERVVAGLHVHVEAAGGE